jgi:acyl-coenzyme A synthetase/AMP-(fatty) acid ligase
MFPPALSALFNEARKDPSLLASLKKVDNAGSGGLTLDVADLEWARKNGIPMFNVFGSTEMGLALMTDASKNDDYLECHPAAKMEFIPIGDTLASGEQLLELVVPPEAPNCPVPSFRSADGKFHSGDLFVEVKPGKYFFRGRNDNWIKMEASLRCDTMSIEANVMETCGEDLVSAVVAVGVGRPCPTIIVEPKEEFLPGHNEGSTQQLKEDILKRITPFHKRRYTHERVDDTRYIVVVPRETLPRTATKGNVRRQEVEKGFQTVLDAVYVK